MTPNKLALPCLQTRKIPSIQLASSMNSGSNLVFAHASCWVSLNSTSVETEIMKGPLLPGSYVVGMMIYPSLLQSNVSSSLISFHGTNFLPSLFTRFFYSGPWPKGQTQNPIIHPTRLCPTDFFQAFSGLLNTILTVVYGSVVFSSRRYFGLLPHVKLSGFASNSLSYKWHPPAVFSSHLPASALLHESCNWMTSTG